MQQPLTFAHLNVRSLTGNFVGFRELIDEYKYDIFVVTETWLSDDTDLNTVHVNGYKLFTKNRETRGGGVAIYVRNAYRTKLLQFFLINVDMNGVEQLWIELNLNHKKYAVGVIYRAPNCSIPQFLTTLEDCLNEILPNFDFLICGGDLNIDLLKIESCGAKLLQNIFTSYDLKQIINEPTRVTVTSSTLIDHIICSESLNIKKSSVNNIHNIADHNLVCCSFGGTDERSDPFMYTFRDFKRFFRDDLLSDFLGLPLDHIYGIEDINIKIDILNNFIINLYDKHAPLKTVLIRKPKAPWLTDTIRLMMKLRDRALIKHKKSKERHHWEYYKTLRNETNNAIKREKKAYLEHQMRTKNKKTLWKDLKDLSIHSRNHDSSLPDHLSDVNEINKYFINSSKPLTTVDQDTIHNYLNDTLPNINEFNFHQVSEDEVYKNLLSIKTKAVGSDKIGINLILQLCPEIVPLLVHIVNFCLEKNVFPSQWKIAEVIPLPKCKEVGDLKDLRPISILPVLSKLLEKIIHTQIKMHLDEYDILPEQQSGFRPNHSCTTALLEVTDDIVSACDNKKLTVLTLIDYSKAFDRINHRLLLAILHFIGFSENSVGLISQYLSQRLQRVKYRDQLSTYLSVDHGVPQGSILGPLLFTIYTSEFKKVLINCKSHFYADDTQVYYSFKEEHVQIASDAVNEDLCALINISTKFCLSINPSKSQVMLFGNSAARSRCRDLINIKIDDQRLKISNVAKNLGLVIDSSLKFSDHVNQIIKRAFSNLKLIYANRESLNKQTKIILCEALVLSHLNFGDVVFHPFLRKADMNRLQRIQNSCVRLIENVKKYDSVSHHLRNLGWLNIHQRQIHHSCCLFHKIITFKTPPYLYKKIRFRTDVHNLNIRHKNAITVPNHKSSLFQCGFTYQIAKQYNMIPHNVKVYSSARFKRELKKFLLSI